MQLGANVSLMPPNVGINKVFSDPAYQTMAQRMGMDPRTYWMTLQPQAQAQHLKRVNAGPAIYTNEDQIDFGNRIGANSPLAAIPEDAPTGSYPPVSAGYEGSPVVPSNPALGPDSSGVLMVPETATPTPGHTAILGTPGMDTGPSADTSVPPQPPQPPRSTSEKWDRVEGQVTPPVLANNATTNQPGALTSGGATSAASRTAAATSGNPRTPTNNTGNARGSGVPDLSVGKGDMWIRMGSAMLANSQNGLANAMGAAGQAYSDVQDENKAYALKKYEMEQAKIAADRTAERARAGSGSGAGSLGPEYINNLMMARDAVLNVVNNPNGSSDLTGIKGVAKGLIDNFTGDDDAARRMILERVRVDDALLRTAQTKGAITEMEMKLFLAPAPTKWQDERVWLDWINQRIDTYNTVTGRMARGETVPFYSVVPDAGAAPTQNPDLMSQADAIVGGY